MCISDLLMIIVLILVIALIWMGYNAIMNATEIDDEPDINWDEKEDLQGNKYYVPKQKEDE